MKYPNFCLKYQFYISKWVCSTWPIEQNWVFMFLIKFPLSHSNTLVSHRKPHSSWASSFHLDRRPHSGSGNSKKVLFHIHLECPPFFSRVILLLFSFWSFWLTFCISAKVFIVVTHLTLLANLCFFSFFVWNMKLLWPLFPPSLVCQLVQCGLTPILCLTPACRSLDTKTVEPAPMEDRRWALSRVEVRHCTCFFSSC